MQAASPPDALHARLEPVLRHLESGRAAKSEKCRRVAQGCALFGGVGAAICAFLSLSGVAAFAWVALPLGLALLVWSSIVAGEKKEYQSGFKMMVMPELVAAFGALRYHGGAGLSEDDFNLANLHEHPDRFSSEDLVEGQIGATKIRFCEVQAQRRETRRDSKGRTTTHYVTFFQGLLVIADFNKHLTGTTYVLPEGLTGSLGNFGAGLQSLGGQLSGRGELVRLEDPEFERHFKAFSNDQIEARYVLSSSLMRRFLDLRAGFGGAVSACFRGESLYLTIALSNNWFEAPSLSTPLDFAALSGVLQQLQSATGIVEILDLNTRIWTKE